MAKQKVRETHISVFTVRDDGTLNFHSSYVGESDALEAAEEKELKAYVVLPVRVVTEIETTTTTTRVLPAITPGEKVGKGGKGL